MRWKWAARGAIALACLWEGMNAEASDGTLGLFNPESMAQSPFAVERTDASPAPAAVLLTRRWQEGELHSTLSNSGTEPVAIRRVVLMRIEHALPGNTGMYGEGFTMLSQTGGTLAEPKDIGSLTDRGHYRIPQPDDATTVYNVLHLAPPEGEQVLLGFTSCKRFVGRFHVRKDSIEVVLETDGLTLSPGETWELETFFVAKGDDRSALFGDFARHIERHHPRLSYEPVPTGWCSWYCFGPMVTRRQVERNLEAVQEKGLPLRFIQIDDGYQAAMGDWLDAGPAFAGGLPELLGSIRAGGGEPAIWVAPFVAEEKSKVFQEHPEWFIKDETGAPLRSDRVTFGGWRLGPWYALDGTHPGAQQHLEQVFRTMREEWGCTYFKLDANFWGAMHGGHFHDPKATRVEAYRRGMEAVLRGAGDAFILGCNHPLWPSLGVVHGSRSSGDIVRSWDVFRQLTRENFSRNWQNGTLWWNDPDCVVLTGDLSDDEFLFHATAIYASGGMTLSGDNLTVLKGERLEMLKKLLPPTGVAAEFRDDRFELGVIRLDDRTLYAVFNWSDAPRSERIAFEGKAQVLDFWRGTDLGMQEGGYDLGEIPPHSARLVVVKPL